MLPRSHGLPTRSETEYGLFLTEVNKLAERRQTVTATYISVNAAVVAALGLIFGDIQMQEWGRQLATLLLLIAGLTACFVWRRLIQRYRILLRWWYERLREMERTIPESHQLLNREYDEVYHTGSGAKSLGLTRDEVYLTWLFTAVYGVFFVITLCILLGLLK